MILLLIFKRRDVLFFFSGKTRVLSTSPLNGGITAHLTHALNINCMNGAYECEMLGNTYEEDLNIHTKSWELIRRQQPHSAQRHGLNCVLLRNLLSGVIRDCCCYRGN